MAKRNVVDFKIINLSEEKFQELKEAGQIDPNALYATPDTTKERLDTLESRATSLEETKQDEATAVNYDNITNCITHIPQDIKLELNNGTLTLKAGSKVYMPNGFEADNTTLHFNTITITADLTLGAIGSYTGQSSLYVQSDGNTIIQQVDSVSGTTAPTGGAWYDINTNLIKQYDGGSDTGNRLSFPIALVTRTSGNWTSIDQVFNGFGYIGSTIFALPGIKWLAPNGRNADGTLRNNAYTSTKAQKFTYPNVNQSNIIICMGTDSFYTSGQVISSETEPSQAYTFWYKPSENILRTKAEGAYNLAQSTIPVGSFNMTTTGVSSVYTKTPFHAVDYNDLYSSTSGSLMSRILYAIYPVGSVYIGTQTECPMKTLMPGSSWVLVSAGRALWTGNGSNGNTTIAAGLPNITGSVGAMRNGDVAIRAFTNASGAFYTSDYGSSAKYAYMSANEQTGVPNKAEFSASRSSSVYGSSNTVQPPAYVVNVWRRTA